MDAYAIEEADGAMYDRFVRKGTFVWDVHMTGDAGERLYRVEVKASTWATSRSFALQEGRERYLAETGCEGVQLLAVER